MSTAQLYGVELVSWLDAESGKGFVIQVYLYPTRDHSLREMSYLWFGM